MFEQMPPIIQSDASKKTERKKEGRFLTEYLKGARKYIATGLGAMILLLSAESLAKGKPSSRAEDAFNELDREVEAIKATPEDVDSSLKSFHNVLDVLQANQSAKEKLKKALDETLAEIDADKNLSAVEKLEGKLEAIGKFRAYLVERLDAQADKAKLTPAPEAAATTESEVKVESRKGAIVVEGETQMGSFDSYVRDGVLSSSYYGEIPDKAKFGIGKTTLLGRLAVLKMRMDAQVQAVSRGEKDKAASLQDAVLKQRKMIQKIYGNILYEVNVVY